MPDTPKQSGRDAAIAILDNLSPDGDTEVQETTEAESTEVEEVDASTEQESVESQETEEEATEEAEESEETEEEEDDEHPELLDADLIEYAEKRTQKRIKEMIEARKEDEPYTEYGRKITQAIYDAGISQEAFNQWVRFGVDIQSVSDGEADAPTRAKLGNTLIAMAQNLGVEASAPAISESVILDGLKEFGDEFGLEGSDLDRIAKALTKKLAPTKEAPKHNERQSSPDTIPAPNVVKAQKEMNNFLARIEREYPLDAKRLQAGVIDTLKLARGARPENLVQLAERALAAELAKYKRVKPQKSPAAPGKKPAASQKDKPKTPKEAAIAILNGLKH